MQWYYRVGEKAEGPVDDEAMRQMVQAGKLGRQDLVRHERMGDRWVPLHQFPMLAALSPETPPPDPAREAELRQHLVREEQRDRRRRTTAWCVGIVLLLAIAGIVAAAVHLKITAPYRALGVSTENPLGTFDRLDRVLTQEFLMDRLTVSNCPGIGRTAPVMCTYTNPKAPRGKYVSGHGSATVLADGQRVTGICIAFTSPGMRAGTSYTVSVFSLWGAEMWGLFDPAKRPGYRPPEQWSAGTWESTGLGDALPRNGSLAVYDGRRTRGCWYEYTPYGLQTLIFLQPKEAAGN